MPSLNLLTVSLLLIGNLMNERGREYSYEGKQFIGRIGNELMYY